MHDLFLLSFTDAQQAILSANDNISRANLTHPYEHTQNGAQKAFVNRGRGVAGW